MAYPVATLALFTWPLVVILLFRKLPIQTAIVVSLVGGYLLLPVRPSFNLPLLPAYNKEMAAALPALVMALVVSRQPVRRGEAPRVQSQPGWLPRVPLIQICFWTILAGALLTVLTNGDSLNYPLRTVPGLRPYDAGAAMLQILTVLLPFLLARKYLARPEDQKMLLTVLAIAALAYSLAALWEVRMSPRLNSQVYGFFPHDWRQHLRAGGFRPVVFLEHGLRLGLFLAVGLLATAITLRLQQGSLRMVAIGGVFWLFATLVLSKNLTAFVIVCMLLPVVLALRPRTQLVAAAVFAGVVLFYPMMRAAGLVPVQTVTSAIASFADGQRLRSLDFRFLNEDAMLDRANERPLFGWGGWGRARVKDSLGRDASTPDGTWIIEFGESGWIGYLARFGLLTGPILLLAFRRGEDTVTFATSGLAVVLAANLIDLLPNSGLTTLTWLMAGSLAGRLEVQAAANEPREEAIQASGDRRTALPYRRHFPSSAPAQRETAPKPQRRASVPSVPMNRQRRSPREST